MNDERQAGCDDDAPYPIAGDPVEHSLEAGPLGNWIATAHGGVIELGNDHVPVRLGKGGDGHPLALVVVLI